MKNIIKVVFVILGTLIGAGFASGQEINLFFFSYGLKGILGIMISSVLMGIVIYKTLDILNKKEINTYKEFLDTLIISKKFNIKKLINSIINIFILITFFIMIAGFGAYIEQEYGLPSIVGSVILAILTFLIFMTSVKGVIKVNELIVPALIIFITIIGFLNLKEINLHELEHYVIRTNQTNYLLSGLLYCSYNSILLIPVLITLKNLIKNKKQIIAVSIITSIIIISLALIIFLLLVRVNVDITKLEMPAVYVVSYWLKPLKNFYGIIILGAIFTTAISLGISFLQNTSKNKKSYTHIALIMCITSVIVSKFGFSNLIELLYPIFGYLGLIQIIKLFFIRKQIIAKKKSIIFFMK